MPRVRHTRRARQDLLDIWVGIAQHDAGAADRLYDRLERRVSMLESLPEIGLVRSDIAPGARILVERPYIVLYRIDGAGPQIVRVLHGARDIGPRLISEGFD